MQIRQITVTAGRTFNHPHEDYSNLKPSVTLVAELTEGEDASEAARKLQAQAEGLVEDHKQSMLRSLEELYQLSQRQQEVQGLQRELKRAQDRLEQIRRENPALQIAAPVAQASE